MDKNKNCWNISMISGSFGDDQLIVGEGGFLKKKKGKKQIALIENVFTLQNAIQLATCTFISRKRYFARIVSNNLILSTAKIPALMSNWSLP